MSVGADTYMLLAMAFQRPEPARWEMLKKHEPFSATLHGTTLEDLRAQYTRLFSLSVAGGVAPYETEYGPKEIFHKTQQLADVSGFYRAFGMEVSGKAHERVDFIGNELEWMGWITLKERFADQDGKQEQATICREASAKFMESHLGCWAGPLAECLGEQATHPFYKTLAEKLHSWVYAECRRLGVHPQRLTRQTSSPPDDTPCGESSCVMQDVAEKS